MSIAAGCWRMEPRAKATRLLDVSGTPSTARRHAVPGVLPSGCAGGACSYTFTLTATHHAAAGPRAAFAQQTILMNMPPRGGMFEVVPSTGYELNGTFALRASYWTDDADDLPLSYAFGFSRAGDAPALEPEPCLEPQP